MPQKPKDDAVVGAPRRRSSQATQQEQTTARQQSRQAGQARQRRINKKKKSDAAYARITTLFPWMAGKVAAKQKSNPLDGEDALKKVLSQVRVAAGKPEHANLLREAAEREGKTETEFNNEILTMTATVPARVDGSEISASEARQRGSLTAAAMSELPLDVSQRLQSGETHLNAQDLMATGIGPLPLSAFTQPRQFAQKAVDFTKSIPAGVAAQFAPEGTNPINKQLQVSQGVIGGVPTQGPSPLAQGPQPELMTTLQAGPGALPFIPLGMGAEAALVKLGMSPALAGVLAGGVEEGLMGFAASAPNQESRIVNTAAGVGLGSVLGAAGEAGGALGRRVQAGADARDAARLREELKPLLQDILNNTDRVQDQQLRNELQAFVDSTPTPNQGAIPQDPAGPLSALTPPNENIQPRLFDEAGAPTPAALEAAASPAQADEMAQNILEADPFQNPPPQNVPQARAAARRFSENYVLQQAQQLEELLGPEKTREFVVRMEEASTPEEANALYERFVEENDLSYASQVFAFDLSADKRFPDDIVNARATIEQAQDPFMAEALGPGDLELARQLVNERNVPHTARVRYLRGEQPTPIQDGPNPNLGEVVELDPEGQPVDIFADEGVGEVVDAPVSEPSVQVLSPAEQAEIQAASALDQAANAQAAPIEEAPVQVLGQVRQVVPASPGETPRNLPPVGKNTPFVSPPTDPSPMALAQAAERMRNIPGPASEEVIDVAVAATRRGETVNITRKDDGFYLEINGAVVPQTRTSPAEVEDLFNQFEPLMAASDVEFDPQVYDFQGLVSVENAQGMFNFMVDARPPKSRAERAAEAIRRAHALGFVDPPEGTLPVPGLPGGDDGGERSAGFFRRWASKEFLLDQSFNNGTDAGQTAHALLEQLDSLVARRMGDEFGTLQVRLQAVGSDIKFLGDVMNGKIGKTRATRKLSKKRKKNLRRLAEELERHVQGEDREELLNATRKIADTKMAAALLEELQSLTRRHIEDALFGNFYRGGKDFGEADLPDIFKDLRNDIEQTSGLGAATDFEDYIRASLGMFQARRSPRLEATSNTLKALVTMTTMSRALISQIFGLPNLILMAQGNPFSLARGIYRGGLEALSERAGKTGISRESGLLGQTTAHILREHGSVTEDRAARYAAKFLDKVQFSRGERQIRRTAANTYIAHAEMLLKKVRKDIKAGREPNGVHLAWLVNALDQSELAPKSLAGEIMPGRADRGTLLPGELRSAFRAETQQALEKALKTGKFDRQTQAFLARKAIFRSQPVATTDLSFYGRTPLGGMTLQFKNSLIKESSLFLNQLAENARIAGATKTGRAKNRAMAKSVAHGVAAWYMVAQMAGLTASEARDLIAAFGFELGQGIRGVFTDEQTDEENPFAERSLVMRVARGDEITAKRLLNKMFTGLISAGGPGLALETMLAATLDPRRGLTGLIVGPAAEKLSSYTGALYNDFMKMGTREDDEPLPTQGAREAARAVPVVGGGLSQGLFPPKGGRRRDVGEALIPALKEDEKETTKRRRGKRGGRGKKRGKRGGRRGRR